MTYKPSKVGQTDLVFGLWSEFIGRSVHGRLQVYVAVVLRATLVNTQTHTHTDSFW